MSEGTIGPQLGGLAVLLGTKENSSQNVMNLEILFKIL